ncbi:hypothetical protein GF352_00250 [archaeon]|nr:hypothetical protein [archaeon]
MIKDYKKHLETFKQIVDDASQSLEGRHVKEYLNLKNGIKSQVKKLLGLEKHLSQVCNYVFKKFFEITGVDSTFVNEYLDNKLVKKTSDLLIFKFLSEKYVKLERLLHAFVINTESFEKRNQLLELNIRNEEFYREINVELNHPGLEHKYNIILSRLIKETRIPAFNVWLIIINNYNAFKKDLTDYQLEKNLEKIEKIMPEKSSELIDLLKRAREYTKKLVKSYDKPIRASKDLKTYFI